MYCIYELDPDHFLSAPRLAWKACLKKAGVKLEILTDVDTLLMVEKRIRGGIFHAIHRYANNKYMKNYDNGSTKSQNLPADGFKWKINMLKFNEDFIKNYDEENDKGYILEVDVKYSKRLHNLHYDLLFLPEIMIINKCNKLVYNLYDKNNCSSHNIFKMSIRLWNNIRENAQSNPV